MSPAIQKATGSTRSELLLEKLAEASFLNLWSWPRPFKDDGKELCDLVAIFEDRVLVFFVRERAFDASDREPELVWSRWKRRVIDKQIATAKGAEKYLRSARAVYVDERLTTKMPLPIPPNPKVHKIVVAHGAKEACLAFSEDNLSGSLAVGYSNAPDISLPFYVRLERHNPVHVLDLQNLETVFAELDTFGDFIAYLEEKEAAVERLDMLTYCGEEDLLAHYLSNFDETLKRYRIGLADPSMNGLHIAEGYWQEFCQFEFYLRRKEANEVSYLWDRLIKKTAANALKGTLGGDANVFHGKSAIHEMAKERRFSRRLLAARIVAAINAFPLTQEPLVRHLTFVVSQDSDKGYVFLQFQGRSFPHYDGYREARRALLEIACGAAKNKFSTLKRVVGIAVEPPKFNTTLSEDFVLLECAEWPAHQRAHYDALNAEIGFFQQKGAKLDKGRAQDFPNNNLAPRKTGRNELCPCGSGRKFKNCHGRF